jgi:hypothetical protein
VLSLSVGIERAAAVNETAALDNWVFDQVAHQYVDGPINVSTGAAGVSCAITVASGKKLLDQKTFVSS